MAIVRPPTPSAPPALPLHARFRVIAGCDDSVSPKLPPCPRSRSGGGEFFKICSILRSIQVPPLSRELRDGRSYYSLRRGEVGKERRMSVKTRTSTYMQPTASTRSKARAPTPRMSPRGIASVTNPADDEHAVGYGTTATKVVRAVSRV